MKRDPGEYFKDSRVAGKYDEYIGENIPYYWPTIRKICTSLQSLYGDATNGMVAIEFGAGTGNLSLSLIENLGIKRMLMLDHSRSMLLGAEEKVRRSGIPYEAILTMESSILADDWKQAIGLQSLDIALFHLSLDHVEEDSDLRRLLRDIYDRLSAGGCLVIAEKCADGRDKESASWLAFTRMVEIRASHMLEHGFMSAIEVELWRQHLLSEDVLRPLDVLWSFVIDAGFRVAEAWGVSLESHQHITYDSFYTNFKIKHLSVSTPISNVAFGIGVLICIKDAGLAV